MGESGKAIIAGKGAKKTVFKRPFMSDTSNTCLSKASLYDNCLFTTVLKGAGA